MGSTRESENNVNETWLKDHSDFWIEIEDIPDSDKIRVTVTHNPSGRIFVSAGDEETVGNSVNEWLNEILTETKETYQQDIPKVIH